ncbi:hypothetical protein [Acinetobacter guerrae]|uniref:hypothetical protein n=1 Tax=Acinetobacter guerrae TaxID=1843371 RepID=UPI00125EB9CB|nr:hypothetical protein [Acinetobacter guerrae]
MAYYNGQVSSYQELQDVLINECSKNGWSVSGNNIISKAEMFFKLRVSNENGNPNGPGLLMQGGNSISNFTSPEVRLGNIAKSIQAQYPLKIVFPINYMIHIFDHEVFLIINYQIDNFMYLAFGQDQFSNAKYLSGSAYQFISDYDQFAIYDNGGGSNSNPILSGAGFFWASSGAGINTKDTVYFDGNWSSTSGVFAYQIETVSALPSYFNLINKIPSLWSSDSVFLPINIFKLADSSKVRLICQIQNAKFTRLDNFEPNQIIELGNDKWKIYPFHKKNIQNRNGGSNINHTGTFGWAIRYDGP